MAEKDRAGKLLGDGAGALLHRALAEVAQHRPHDANVVDAIVLIEAPILSGHESLLQQQGHLAAGQLLPGSRTLLEDHFAIGRQDGEGARSRKSANAAGIGEQGIDAGDQKVLAEGRGHSQSACQQGRPPESGTATTGLSNGSQAA